MLPPLRDVKNRPEVGNSLRNKLVRLMTHIDTDVKHCAAEFLFVLCKESGESQGVLGRGKGDPLQTSGTSASPWPSAGLAVGTHSRMINMRSVSLSR